MGYKNDAHNAGVWVNFVTVHTGFNWISVLACSVYTVVYCIITVPLKTEATNTSKPFLRLDSPLSIQIFGVNTKRL